MTLTLLEALGEGVLENAGDNLLVYVRNAPRLTRDDLLTMRGLMTVLGVQEVQLPLWRAIEASLTEDARERERLLETLAHPWYQITHEVYAVLQQQLAATIEIAPGT